MKNRISARNSIEFVDMVCYNERIAIGTRTEGIFFRE